MTEELALLRDIVTRLDAAKIDYMLTGSVALNCYAQPRMTRDIDLVVAFLLKDAERINDILGQDYYVSEHAAREAVSNLGCFNAIHQTTLIKVDFMVRKTGGLSAARIHATDPAEGRGLRSLGGEQGGPDPFQAPLGKGILVRTPTRRC